MRKALAVTGLILLILLILCGIMMQNADAAPIQRNLTVELDALPQGTRPLRVVLMSAFHVARFGNTPRPFEQTVDRVTALHPDLILLAGDFLQVRELGGYPVRESVAPLAK